MVTDVTLGMYYSFTISEAFISVKHTMRDVNNGWLIHYYIRILYLVFFLVYLQIGRGLYYGLYRAPRILI